MPDPHDVELPEDTQQDLMALRAFLASLPDAWRDRGAELVDKVEETTKRRRHLLLMVQDALGQLRLDMKYLLFDLEATRRERDAYRQLLEESDEGDA